MSERPKIDRLVELALGSELHPLSSVALKLALVLEERSESVSRLADLILSDVALTNRILRAVNSPLYRRPGWDGNVTTVSKALLLLGFDQVRDMALALEMLRQRRADPRNPGYELACLQSMRAVGLVRHLVEPAWLEHATIPTLLRATGAVACALVAPEQLDALRDSGDDQIVAERLCRQWGLPEELLRTLAAPTRRGRIAAGSDEYLRAISLYCHQLARLWAPGMTTLDAPAVGWFDALHELTGLPQERIRDLLARAVEEADEAFQAALGGPAP
ncbi:MAG: HDOD domain-containing protein, partial [Burkholderiaceae bacterium]